MSSLGRAALALTAIVVGCTPSGPSPKPDPQPKRVITTPPTAPPGRRAAGVEAGGRSSCVRWEDGEVTCSGRVVGGRARTIPALSGAQSLAVSDEVVCGLDGYERLTCVGPDLLWRRDSLDQATGLTVASGHVCALDRVQPRCWSLGDGSPIPLEFSPPNTRFVGASDRNIIVVEGKGTTHVFSSDGSHLRTRGGVVRSNVAHNGRVCIDTGLGMFAEPGCKMGPDPAPGFEPRAHYAGGVCGLADDGLIRCFGDGLGTNDRAVTWRAPMGLVDVRDMSAGDDHACAVGGDGRVWCWGRAEDGQLGFLPQQPQHLSAEAVDVHPATRISLGWRGRICAHGDAVVRHCAEPGRRGFAPGQDDRLWAPEGALWDVGGMDEWLRLHEHAPTHEWVGQGTIGGATGRALEFSAGCSRFASGRVGCVHPFDLADGPDHGPAADYVLAPYRGLGRARAMRAWQGDVCTRGRDDQIRCVARPMDEGGTGWAPERATVVFEAADAFTVGPAGVCIVADGAVRCSDTEHALELPQLGEGRLLVTNGNAVCAAVERTDARCVINLPQALRGQSPRVLDASLHLQPEQLVTDGTWLCARDARGAVSCAGDYDARALGDTVVPQPIDATTRFDVQTD